MQQSQNTLQSHQTAAMKKLYHHHSTTFKNINNLKRHSQIFKSNMIKSSGVPFNAFNSTTNIVDMKNYAFYNQFNKNSEDKSIIQKLMQTRQPKQLYPREGQQQAYIMNQLNNINIDINTTIQTGVTLTQTQQKIFRQIINLLTQIQQIKQINQKQNQDVSKLKQQMKQSGINWPFQQEQTKASLSLGTLFHRYNQQQLQKMFEQNQKLELQLERVTQQITNKNASQKQKQLQYAMKNNKKLMKQLSTIKAQVRNTGQIDQQQISELKMRIDSLNRQVFKLEQRRLGSLSEKDQQLFYLKNQNEDLRNRTIQLLKIQGQTQYKRYQSYATLNPRKQQLIRYLQNQDKNRQVFKEQIQLLKQRYQILLHQNQRLRKQEYNNTIQLQSKVSTFRQNVNTFNRGKQNYIQNFDPKASKGSQKKLKFDNQDNYSKFSMKYQTNRYPSIGINQTTITNNRLSQYQQFLNKMKQNHNY